MDKLTHQMRLSQWTSVVKACSESGFQKTSDVGRTTSTLMSITTGNAAYAKQMNDKDTSFLDSLIPWSNQLPEVCRQIK